VTAASDQGDERDRDRAPSATLAFPRRIFLARSLQTMATVAALPGMSLLASGCGSSTDVKIPAGLKTFTADEYRIATAVGATLIPEGGAFEHGATSLEVALRLDEFLVNEHRRVAQAVSSALWTLEYGGLLLVGQIGRFTSMSPERRTRYFEKLPLGFQLGRDIYLGLKHSYMFLFYNIDATWEPLGYDGPWLRSSGLRPRGEAAAGGRRAARKTA